MHTHLRAVTGTPSRYVYREACLCTVVHYSVIQSMCVIAGRGTGSRAALVPTEACEGVSQRHGPMLIKAEMSKLCTGIDLLWRERKHE